MRAEHEKRENEQTKKKNEMKESTVVVGWREEQLE
jgi:hypothetical protein